VCIVSHRSPRATDLAAPSGERDGDKSTKTGRQRALRGKQEVAMMASENKRHSAPLPADSSQHQSSTANSSVSNLARHSMSPQRLTSLTPSRWMVLYSRIILWYYDMILYYDIIVRRKSCRAGLFRTHQHYHHQWLPNTEWSNSRWAWTTDRWLLRERQKTTKII